MKYDEAEETAKFLLRALYGDDCVKKVEDEACGEPDFRVVTPSGTEEWFEVTRHTSQHYKQLSKLVNAQDWRDPSVKGSWLLTFESSNPKNENGDEIKCYMLNRQLCSLIAEIEQLGMDEFVFQNHMCESSSHPVVKLFDELAIDHGKIMTENESGCIRLSLPLEASWSTRPRVSEIAVEAINAKTRKSGFKNKVHGYTPLTLLVVVEFARYPDFTSLDAEGEPDTRDIELSGLASVWVAGRIDSQGRIRLWKYESGIGWRGPEFVSLRAQLGQNVRATE